MNINTVTKVASINREFSKRAQNVGAKITNPGVESVRVAGTTHSLSGAFVHGNALILADKKTVLHLRDITHFTKNGITVRV